MHDEAIAIAAILCKRFEGFRSRPYLCPAGVATIGYGSTVYANGYHVTLLDPAITRDAAQKLLIHELEARYLPAVIKLCSEIDTPSRLAAILDFTYNLGVGALKGSTLRKKINACDWVAATYELKKWVNGGGKKLTGLFLRRQAECDLI